MKERPLVLIVDDQPDNLYMYSRYFEELGGLRIVTAMTGREALIKAKRFQPDAILLDLTLPEMNGFEIARALADDPATAGIPVVLASAYASEAEAVQALGSRFASFVGQVAQGYVTKPCEPEALLHHVKQVVGTRVHETA